MDDTNDIDKLFELLSISHINEEICIPHGGWVPRDIDGYKYRYNWGLITSALVYKNAAGYYHRLYGPAVVCKAYGLEMWFKDGVFHRDGGPCLTHKTTQYWALNGVLHCLSGPAVLSPVRPKEFWINGQKLSPKEYKKEISRRKRKGLIQ